MITIEQHGNNLVGSSLIYPHSYNYPAFFTCTSTQSSSHIDFKYEFKLYDTTGLIFTTRKAPSIDMMGIFNSSPIMKDTLGIDLNDITDGSNVNYLKEYRVTVQEYYDGALQGSPVEYEKSQVGLLSYNQTDSRLPYIISNNNVGEFLTHMSGTGTQSLNTRGKWLFPINNYLETINLVKYTLEHRTTGGDIYIYTYSLDVTSTYTFNPSDSTIDVATSATRQIPIGYGNLDETQLDLIGYTLNGGTFVSTPGSRMGIGSEVPIGADIRELTVALYNGVTLISKVHKWKLSDCDNKSITINWKNVLGGVEFFNFNKVREDKLNNKRKTYVHNNLDVISNGLYNSPDNNNVTVYSCDKSYSLKLRTKFLNVADVALLKGMFYSNDMVVFIEGVKYPVQAITNTQVIKNKEMPEFLAYDFEVKYGKILR